jgi:hypothetical protein
LKRPGPVLNCSDIEEEEGEGGGGGEEEEDVGRNNSLEKIP